MTLQQMNRKCVWKPVSHPDRRGFQPACYSPLLSALDQGWRIVDIALTPAPDQGGLVYIITMRHPTSRLCQEMILPCTALTENLLNDIRQPS